MAGNPVRLLSLLSLALPTLVASNQHDSLFDWQISHWRDNPEAIMLSTNQLPGDDAGVYARSGSTPHVLGNTEGLQAPVEFFWGSTDGGGSAMSSDDQTLQGFVVEDLGNNQTLLGFAPAPLRSVIFRVRRLNDRWIGVFLHLGEPVAIYYTWAKVKYVWGIPTDVDYLSIHGFKIKDCTISDEEVAFAAYKGGVWELERGMEDPLWRCDLPPPSNDVVLSDSSASAEFNNSRRWLLAGTIFLAGFIVGGLVLVLAVHLPFLRRGVIQTGEVHQASSSVSQSSTSIPMDVREMGGKSFSTGDTDLNMPTLKEVGEQELADMKV